MDWIAAMVYEQNMSLNDSFILAHKKYLPLLFNDVIKKR